MRILIVEDSFDEQQKAETAVIAAGHEAITVSMVSSAIKRMGKEDWDESGTKRTYTKRESAPDAVLSDVMVPWGENDWGLQVPGGVLVGWACEKLDIPFVFCTSGHHHGPSYQWVDMFTLLNNWPRMIDGNGIQGKYKEDEHGTKNWERALSELLKRVNT